MKLQYFSSACSRPCIPASLTALLVRMTLPAIERLRAVWFDRACKPMQTIAKRCRAPCETYLRQPCLKQDGGFALVTVLWFSILLSLLGISLLREASATKTLAVTSMARLQVQAIADGAINLVILTLLESHGHPALFSDGSVTVVHLHGRDVALRVEREIGKIDINTANSELLVVLLRYAGASMDEAKAIAAGVIAWRTPRNESADDSADLPYLDAGRSYGPRRGPFRAVAELRLILGMTDALQSAVTPLTTIWSLEAGIDLSAASDATLGVLAAAGDSLAVKERLERKRGLMPERGDLPDRNETVTIAARITSDNSWAERQAVIRFAHGRVMPFEGTSKRPTTRSPSLRRGRWLPRRPSLWRR